MALPDFREDGWLPAGHYAATWQEVASRFSGEPNTPRAAILASLLEWRDAVRARSMAGLIILDGSFISSKKAPGDFDLVFSYDAATEAVVQHDRDARALTDFQACRTLGYLGDIFALPASLGQPSPALSGLDMFDFDRQGRPKGVIEAVL